MTLSVYFFSGDKKTGVAQFKEGEAMAISIGRSNTDILLDAPVISGLHAQLIYDGTQLYVSDCNSANGTFINNTRLAPGRQHLLVAGDIISFAKGFSAKLVNSNDASSDPQGDKIALSKTISYHLQHKDEVTIGRSKDCDIVLDHETVSRVHARVKSLGNGRFLIQDNGSLNGTFKNGVRIKKAEVSFNDKIFIGRFKLMLGEEFKDLSTGSAVMAKGVSKRYKKKDELALHEINVDIPSGGLIAIMGPSGCGKSTLLKVLNGSLLPTTGNVLINGLDLIENYPYLKTQISYVPQDDIVHKELTVEQSLFYAGKMRLNGIADEKLLQRINKLLTQLKIEEVRHHQISQISGGQRKRVSIAIELLSDPAILFLDEPTSPLDPETIDEFLKILKELSKSNTTIILVTHKPEDLNYMDKVIFMAKGGIPAYYGSITGYKEYFGVSSAIEVYSLLSGKHAAKWTDKFNRSNLAPISSGILSAKKPVEKINSWGQFYWLFRRYKQIKFNDWKNTIVMVLQAPIIAVFICLIFKEIRLAVLFLSAISAIWFGINNSAREIAGEQAIYQRERNFNLRLFPYIFSKITLLSFFAFAQAVLFNIIIYLFYYTHHNTASWTNPVASSLWMFMLILSGSFCGLYISSASGTTEKAMSIVPIVIIPQIMLAGVVAVITSRWVELISYLTLSRWGTEGFTHLQEKIFDKNPVPARFHTADTTLTAYPALKHSFHNSYEIVFGKYAGTLKLDAIVLTVFISLCLAGTWISLRKKDNF